MIVNEISLDAFRNYSAETVRFEEGVNVIVGKNAQGKTNLIEAIYYITAGKSFRPATDKDLISFKCETASVKASVESIGRQQSLEIRLFRRRRRELYANGAKLKKTIELTGRLTSVMFGPDDLNMIKDGAVVRRKLMDHSLSQLRPGYLAALTEFNKLHEHKTRILKHYREKPSLLELLDDYDLRLAEQSARLIYYRTAFAAGISRRAASIHRDFSDGTEELSIRYKTVGSNDFSGKKPDQILPELIKHQQEHRQAELHSGYCLSGAHKDDLEIYINGIPARKYASQGQARTAAVSVKLAERDIHYDDKGEYPILLLDDVLSELDQKRQSFILDKITDGQVLITCCDENEALSAFGGSVLRIENGKLKEKNPVRNVGSL
ncbi:MAG: DNA replication/repair protein RecF [Oscillospiraceae bacterium]|nr:DNA replication/repair protein RecF [Oscillospiraceae bacterium]